MNLVIRFHPNTELLLIEEQKKFILEINSRFEKCISFPFYPLVCPLNNDFFKSKNQAEIKNIFSDFVIRKIFTEKDKIFFEAKLKLIGGQNITEKFTAGTSENANLIQNKEKDLNLKCRTFQIAEIKKTGFTYELWNPVWCKCKTH
ncbi:MAG: hypothetical protein IJL70_03770 [Treponema sp.]|nr:hypothetical protein [Treponema sp.]